MVRFVQPTRYCIDGVLLLEAKDLIDLDSLVDGIEKTFRRHLNRRISEEAKKRLESAVGDETINDYKKSVRKHHPYNIQERSVDVICKSGNEFKGRIFADILGEPKLKDEKPSSAKCHLRYGQLQIDVDLSNETLFTSSLIVSSPPHLAVVQHATSTIVGWAEERQRFLWWKKAGPPIGFIGLFFLMLSFLDLPNGLFTVRSDKSALLKESRSMLADGIDKSEIKFAIEALLRFETDDFEKTVEVDIKPWFIAMCLIGVGCISFWIFRPRSLLGIGKNLGRLKVTRFYTKHVWIWISMWSVGILTSALGSSLYDLITKR